MGRLGQGRAPTPSPCAVRVLLIDPRCCQRQHARAPATASHSDGAKGRGRRPAMDSAVRPARALRRQPARARLP